MEGVRRRCNLAPDPELDLDKVPSKKKKSKWQWWQFLVDALRANSDLPIPCDDEHPQPGLTWTTFTTGDRYSATQVEGVRPRWVCAKSIKGSRCAP